MNLTIYRGILANTTVKIDENTILSQKLLGEDFIRLEQMYTSAADILIGDYITVDSKNYYVNTLPSIRKVSSREFEHSVVFEAQYYEIRVIT